MNLIYVNNIIKSWNNYKSIILFNKSVIDICEED